MTSCPVGAETDQPRRAPTVVWSAQRRPGFGFKDPKADVRVSAVHSLSCETCKDGPNPIDAIPLLLDRIELDESIRVRRQAVAMLAHHRAPDARVLPVFRKILTEEDDRKLRLHAEQGVRRYAEAGLRE